MLGLSHWVATMQRELIMRKIVKATAIVAWAIAAPAMASDEGDWTGAYVGVSVGYADSKSDQSVAVSGSWASESQALRDHVTAFFPSQAKVEDVTFGGQLGYNYQTGSVVVGLEGSIDAVSGKDATLRGPTPTVPFPALSYTVSNSYDPKVNYSLRGKLGVASGNTMFYATGGWGWTSADIDVDISSNGGYHKTANLSRTFNGFDLGAGIEHRLGSNMSLRLEYIYSDRGDFTYDTAYAAGSSFPPPAFNYVETFTQDLRMHQVRLGMNFHF